MKWFWSSLCIILVGKASNLAAIRCYECGTGGDAPPCQQFMISPLWRPFEVECPSSPPHICVKTVTDGYPDSQVRSCSPVEDSRKMPLPLGCGSPTDISETIFCLCEEDLCNSVDPIVPFRSAFLLLFSTLIVTVTVVLF